MLPTKLESIFYATHATKMKSKLKAAQSPPSNGKWMLMSMLLLALLMAATQAAEEKTVKSAAAAPATAPSSSSATSANRDEIYIDDDGIEGSSGRGGIHDDLEKDPDYSGSGFGPDDEDAITDHHQSSHNTRVQSASNSNTHTPTPRTTTTTQTTPKTTATTTATTTTTSTTTEETVPTSSTPNPITSHNTTSLRPSLQHNQTQTDIITPQTPDEAVEEDLEEDLADLDDSLQGSGDDNDDDDNEGEDDNDDDNDDDDDDDVGGVPRTGDFDDRQTLHGTKVTQLENADKTPTTDKEPIDLDDDDELFTEVTGSADVFGGSGGSNVHGLDPNTNVISQPTDTKIVEHVAGGSGEVVIMSDEDRTTSFFAQPGILAAVIGGAVVGLLCAILVVMFIVYRMRKKDEGSYALDEPKRSPANNSYAKNANNREFYA